MSVNLPVTSLRQVSLVFNVGRGGEVFRVCSCLLQGGANEAVQVLSSQHAALGSFLQTVLLLLHEQHKGKSSWYYPWLTTLPDKVDCVMAWPASDKAELQGEVTHLLMLVCPPTQEGWQSVTGRLCRNINFVPAHDVAGTAVDEGLDSARVAFDDNVLPVMRLHPDLWPDSLWWVAQGLSKL